MTEQTYALFQKTNPRIRSYEREQKNPDDSNAKVVVGAACSREHRGELEKFMRVCGELGEATVKITSENEIINFIIEADYSFSDRLIKDFI